jgi:hypothetical protein
MKWDATVTLHVVYLFHLQSVFSTQPPSMLMHVPLWHVFKKVSVAETGPLHL